MLTGIKFRFLFQTQRMMTLFLFCFETKRNSFWSQKPDSMHDNIFYQLRKDWNSIYLTYYTHQVCVNFGIYNLQSYYQESFSIRDFLHALQI